jgi:hypothetical protein
MTLSELIKSIFKNTRTQVLEEREERIKADEDLAEYKHVVHVLLSGASLGDYNNNNLYFVIKNHDKSPITTFSNLLSNYEPYESIIIYNKELDNTNMCVIKNAQNSFSYNGAETELPININENDVIIVEDNCIRLS